MSNRPLPESLTPTCRLSCMSFADASYHAILIHEPKLPLHLLTLHLTTPLVRSPSQEGLEFSFSPLEIVLSAGAALFSAWYLKQRHWFASNVLGLAFSLQGIEHLSLGSVAVGVILLAGRWRVLGWGWAERERM